MKEDIFVLDTNNIHVFWHLFQEPLKEWFSDDKIGFGVICDGQPAALLLSTINEEAVWLDWIYVREQFRQKGVTYRLLNCFFRNMKRLTTENRVYTACEDTMIRHCLGKAGFEFDEPESHHTLSAPLSKLYSVPDHKPDKAVQLLKGLDARSLKLLNNAIAASGAVGVELPVMPLKFMRESLVYLEKNEIKAALLLKKEGNAIDVAYAYLAGNDGKPLIKLISAEKKLLLNSYDENTLISMTTLNAESEKLAKHLFPDAEKQSVWTGSFDLNLI